MGGGVSALTEEHYDEAALRKLLGDDFDEARFAELKSDDSGLVSAAKLLEVLLPAVENVAKCPVAHELKGEFLEGVEAAEKAMYEGGFEDVNVGLRTERSTSEARANPRTDRDTTCTRLSLLFSQRAWEDESSEHQGVP